MNRVLIIEDDNNILQLERDYLEAAGFKTEYALDGKTGVDRAVNEKFDLILLDIMLPELDGFQVCSKIRSVTDIPIILVSAKRRSWIKLTVLASVQMIILLNRFHPASLWQELRHISADISD